MIINKIEVKNFLKYRSLSLSNLSANFSTAIWGCNESGKSSIGEIICFALFGRTYSLNNNLNKSKVKKAVHWGETEALVCMEFEHNGKVYTITRTLNDEGFSSVELSQTEDEISNNETSNNETRKVVGESEVADFIESTLGYNYFEYVDTFYLAQRDIAIPDLKNSAVEKVSGVKEFNKIQQNIFDYLKDIGQVLTSSEDEVIDLNKKINESREAVHKVKDLEKIRSEIEGDLEDIDRRRVSLNDAIKELPNAIERLKKKTSKLSQLSSESSYAEWRELFYDIREDVQSIDFVYPEFDNNEDDPLASIREIVADIELRLLGFEELFESVGEYRDKLARMLGEHSIGAISDDEENPTKSKLELDGQINNLYGEKKRGVIFFVSAIVVTLFLQLFISFSVVSGVVISLIGVGISFFYLYKLYAIKKTAPFLEDQRRLVLQRIESIQEEANIIDSLISIPISKALEFFKGFNSAEVASIANTYSESAAKTFIEDGSMAIFISSIKTTIANTSNDISNRLDSIDGEQRVLGKQKIVLINQKEELQKSISNMNESIVSEKELSGQIDELNKTIDTIKSKRLILSISLKQLDAFTGHLLHVFSKKINLLVSKILPILTLDKYSSVKIDNEMDILVFSSEKGDFVDFDELSSGARRQVLLSIRIAICHEYLEKYEIGQHFIFLDEPFAFFDMARIEGTLTHLPKLSSLLKQYFISGQNFSDELSFDARIECKPEEKELVN